MVLEATPGGIVGVRPGADHRQYHRQAQTQDAHQVEGALEEASLVPHLRTAKNLITKLVKSDNS